MKDHGHGLIVIGPNIYGDLNYPVSTKIPLNETGHLTMYERAFTTTHAARLLPWTKWKRTTPSAIYDRQKTPLLRSHLLKMSWRTYSRAKERSLDLRPLMSPLVNVPTVSSTEARWYE